MTTAGPADAGDRLVPWSRVAGFIRQFTHDVRNGLHGLDLETALLHELITEGEASEGVERVHKQLRAMAAQLRSVSATFQVPQPMTAPIPARALMRIWRENHAAIPNAPEVVWRDELGEEQVVADVAMMGTVFRELLANAAGFPPSGPITISAVPQGGSVIFEMTEPKKERVDPTAWGAPFSSTRRAKYGLGLWAAGRLMEASGVAMQQEFVLEESCLRTRLAVPKF